MHELTVIIQVDQLSRELSQLIRQINFLDPKYLIINSLEQDVINYTIDNYSKHHLTCSSFTNCKNLLQQIKYSYQSQYYLCLQSIDSKLTAKYLKQIINQFIKSRQTYGYLTNILQSDQLIHYNRLDQTIQQINPRLILYQQSNYLDKIKGRKGKKHKMKKIKTTSKSQLELLNCYIPSKLKLPKIGKKLLVNRIVIITGALGGIGQATANHYYNQGWRVIGIDRLSTKQISDRQKKYFNSYHRIDLSRTKISPEISLILKELKRLDALIHIAGIQSEKSIIETNNLSHNNEWDRLFNVNVKSIYTLAQMCHPLLKKSRGSLNIISSVHAFASSRNISVYAISKSALLGLVRNFAIEWGADQIRVNGIAPGAIDTAMLEEGLSRRGNPAEIKKKLTQRHLMGKIGQPEDIASILWFLCDSRQSGFITGQTIIADGGASILLSTEV